MALQQMSMQVVQNTLLFYVLHNLYTSKFGLQY